MGSKCSVTLREYFLHEVNATGEQLVTGFPALFESQVNKKAVH